VNFNDPFSFGPASSVQVHPSTWMVERGEEIRFEILLKSEKNSSVTRNLRLEASKCMDWEFVCSQILDTIHRCPSQPSGTG
jgi:hypothetical protein